MRIINSLLIAALICLFVEPSRAYTITAKWATGVREYKVNPINQDGLSEPVLRAAIQSAFNYWWEQSGAAIKVTDTGTTTTTTSANDGQSNVFFRPGTNPDNPYTVGYTYGWWSNSIFIDVDVILYDGYASFGTIATGCSGVNGAYLEDLMAHEAGHFVGLNHTTVVGATMMSGISYCSTSQRSLEADDIAGIKALYPLGQPVPVPVPVPVPTPTPTPVPSPSLSAVGSKVQGRQRVNLKWSGFSNVVSVDIIRGATVILGGTPNDGAHLDNIGQRGGGSYTYTVCPTGTAVGCTDTVTVTF